MEAVHGNCDHLHPDFQMGAHADTWMCHALQDGPVVSVDVTSRQAAAREAKLFEHLRPTQTFLPAQLFRPQTEHGLCNQATCASGLLNSRAALGSNAKPNSTFALTADATTAAASNASNAFPSYPCQCDHQQPSGARDCPLHSHYKIQTRPFIWPTTTAGWAYAAAGCGVGILEAPSALLRQTFEVGSILNVRRREHWHLLFSICYSARGSEASEDLNP